MTCDGRVVCFAPKVGPPKIRPGTVGRTRLVDRLLATEATEIAISAPAGYGKSTLAAIWAERDERAFGWVTVDEADNDPVVFLTYLVLALDSIGPVDDRLVDDLTTTPAPWRQVLTHLLDTLAAMPTPFVLVIDDAHRLAGPSATDVLPAVASRIPATSALVTIGRGRAPYPSSRGLVAGRVLGLGVEDLAMDASEAAALLLAAGIEPDRWESDALHEKIEGWPAGLYMAALALRNADVPEQAVRHFTGGDHLVTEYFAEEILRAMSADDLDFLLSTAILTRLSGTLCDDVLGIVGSGATLERLANDNQFVIPLDHDGEWYRYHHLFGEMLLTEMRARQPDVVRDVAGRASAWFDERGEPEPAIEHALAVHDERAAALIFRHSPTMLATNRVDTVGHWLSQYAEQDIERVPASR